MANRIIWAIGAAGVAGLATVPFTARAQGAVEVEAVYTADVVATVAGGVDRRARYLDNLDLTVMADMDALIGWKGARIFVYALNNNGRIPNDGAGTVQGINNIEVVSHGPRLYEAWVEQDIGDAVSIRAGLYDLNSEFYATETSDLLIAPPFGIGSELAATGVAGPSIFPSTALGVRVRAGLGEAGYVQAALINAHAGTWGDAGGIDTRFREGALAIAEAGWGKDVRLSAGVWTYTKRQDDIYATDALTGDPLRRKSRGVYAMVQWPVAAQTSFFARGGVSDGDTGPFKGGFQAGILREGILPGREESAASIGVHRGWLSKGYRAALRDGGAVPDKSETAVELTLSDRIAPHVSVQPDVQYIFNPGGDGATRDALVLSLRMTFDF